VKKPSLRRSVAFATVAAGMFALCLPSHAAGGEYRLRAGDTIEISVVGAPDLKQRLTLDVDGQIRVALVGALQASGLTISKLTDELQKVLPAKALHASGIDVKAGQRAIDQGEIVINVVEYSPVYVDGDVTKPGEVHFRPNLTVRQVVALAGGYEVMRYHFVDPVILSADLGAEYQSLWIEQAREQTHLAKLRAQLSDKAETGFAAAQTPISSQLANDFATNEMQQFTHWNNNLRKDKDFLTRAVASANGQLAELTEQREKEKEGVQSDTAELQRLQQFNQMGNVTTNRVVEQRRSMLLSSTRLLQTEAQLTQITREREDYLRRIERLNEVTKLEILKELQETQAKLAAIDAKIAATASKIDYAGTMRSQLALRTNGKPSVLIVRRIEDSTVHINAEEDTTLEPGDVIEISLHHGADKTASVALVPPTAATTIEAPPTPNDTVPKAVPVAVPAAVSPTPPLAPAQAALDPAAACSRDEQRLAKLMAEPVRDQIVGFAKELACPRLRAQVQHLLESVGATDAAGATSPWAPPKQQQAEAKSAPDVCTRDGERLQRLRASPNLDEIRNLERELACEQLRPQLSRLLESVGP
jgi:polysaccharide biosynthesis/export protein